MVLALRRLNTRWEAGEDKCLLAESPAWLRPRTRFTASDMVRTVDTVMEEAGPRPTDGDSVLITSIHRAKGLEWPVVLVPGVEEGRFPAMNSDALATS